MAGGTWSEGSDPVFEPAGAGCRTGSALGHDRVGGRCGANNEAWEVTRKVSMPAESRMMTDVAVWTLRWGGDVTKHRIGLDSTVPRLSGGLLS